MDMEQLYSYVPRELVTFVLGSYEKSVIYWK